LASSRRLGEWEKISDQLLKTIDVAEVVLRAWFEKYSTDPKFRVMESDHRRVLRQGSFSAITPFDPEKGCRTRLTVALIPDEDNPEHYNLMQREEPLPQKVNFSRQLRRGE